MKNNKLEQKTASKLVEYAPTADEIFSVGTIQRAAACMESMKYIGMIGYMLVKLSY